MPRNSSGTYSLPAGNPVVTLTVISSTWANTTLSDISTALTGSLDRSGQGAMLAGLKAFDGVIGAPGYTWGTETTAGIYRNAPGDFRFAIGGVDVFRFATGGSIGLFGNGTVGAPAISWVSEPTSGFYRAGAADFRYALGGVDFIQWTTNLEQISGTAPVRRWNESDAAANNRLWDIIATGEDFLFRALTDALVATNWLTVSRTAGVVDSAVLATRLEITQAGTNALPSLLLNSTEPWFIMNESDGAADNKRWYQKVGGEFIEFGILNDANSVATAWLVVNRTGTTVDTVNFFSGTLQYGGVEVGYRGLPNRSFTASDSTVDSDNGRAVIYAGVGGHTFTLDADVANTGLVTILNAGAGNITVAASGTLSWYNGSGTISTGSRTLVPGGVASGYSIGSGNYLLWGTGLS